MERVMKYFLSLLFLFILGFVFLYNRNLQTNDSIKDEHEGYQTRSIDEKPLARNAVLPADMSEQSAEKVIDQAVENVAEVLGNPEVKEESEELSDQLFIADKIHASQEIKWDGSSEQNAKLLAQLYQVSEDDEARMNAMRTMALMGPPSVIIEIRSGVYQKGLLDEDGKFIPNTPEEIIDTTSGTSLINLPPLVELR
jgi:hypothetical protein